MIPEKCKPSPSHRGLWGNLKAFWRVRNPIAYFRELLCELIQHWFGTSRVLEKSWQRPLGLLCHEPDAEIFSWLPGVLGCWKDARGAWPRGQEPSTLKWCSSSPAPPYSPNLSVGFGAIKWLQCWKERSTQKSFVLGRSLGTHEEHTSKIKVFPQVWECEALQVQGPKRNFYWCLNQVEVSTFFKRGISLVLRNY